MMVSPRMFTESFVGSHLWHFQNRGVIYMLLFNISRGFFCFFFSFRSTKDGLVGGEEGCH